MFVFLFTFVSYSFYILLFVFTYSPPPLDLENHESDEHVPLQPLNGALPIVGGYIYLLNKSSSYEND